MSILLADIDATCSSLGQYDGNKYIIQFDAIQSLKVKIIIFCYLQLIYLVHFILAFNLDTSS